MDKTGVSIFYDRVDAIWKKEQQLHYHIGYFYGEEELSAAQDNLVDKFGEALELENGDVVLDIGCGSGYTALQLTSVYRCRVLGINISDTQLKNCKDLAGNNPDVKFVKLDANNMTFSENTFDKAYAIESIMHMDRDAVISGVKKSLKDGKKFCLCDWYIRKPLSCEENKFIGNMIYGSYLSKDEYMELLNQHCFSAVTFEDWSMETEKTYDYWLPNQTNTDLENNVKKLTDLARSKLGYCFISCKK